MRKINLLFLLLILCTTISVQSRAQKTTGVYDIFFKNDKIGTVTAMEIRSGTTSTKDLRTVSDAKVFAIEIQLEMDVNTIMENGIMTRGTAYKHANRGNENVHAITTKTGPKAYSIQRNGVTSALTDKQITNCVIDLYFSEPKGLTSVFSNMYAQDIPIKMTGAGKYEVTTPNKKTTVYTYQNGKLVTIESETPLGMVTTRKQ